jgi:hypothetical protein
MIVRDRASDISDHDDLLHKVSAGKARFEISIPIYVIGPSRFDELMPR